MIVQQINLYQERFKKKRIWLSASQMLIFGSLVLVVLAYSSYWYQQQYQIVERQNIAYTQQQEQAVRKLSEQKERLQKLLADNQIDLTITKVSNDISARKRLIDFIEKNQFGSGKGFSGYLTELSEIKLNNVWLSEISLAAGDMKLNGSALDAESIPHYFNMMRQRQLFRGQEFDVFEVQRSAEHKWKVDFLIASRVTQDE